MPEIIDKSLYGKYEKLAVFILPYVHPNLITTYEKFIQNQEPEKYIYKNYILSNKPEEKESTSSKPEVTLQDIIAVSTFIALSKENIAESLRTYREYRRFYKRNWFASIKEEIETPNKLKPKNPQFLRKFAEMKLEINSIERNEDTNNSIEDIMLEKYHDVDKWKTDTSAPITDFPFISNKSSKSIANSFVYDITFESIIIILNYFNGSIEGFNVKFPTNLAGHPIIGYRSTDIHFEAIYAQELIFMDSYKFNPDIEDRDVEGNVEVTFNFENLPANINPDNYAQMLKKYNVDLKQRDLDMKDREIMTYLFNMISGDTLAQDLIMVNLREFTQKIYNVLVPKSRHYEDLEQRLYKLKTYEYKITIRDRITGELVESSSVSLLTYLYINYEAGYFQFAPSKQWIDAYVQKQYFNILTDTYRSIDSVQTKGIMMILQRERIIEYSKGNYSKHFLLTYWRTHMKTFKMSNHALVKELKTHFTILKEKGHVIKDFQFASKNTGVQIEFLPLDEKEIIAYDFSQKSLENKKILEVPFQELDSPQ